MLKGAAAQKLLHKPPSFFSLPTRLGGQAAQHPMAGTWASACMPGPRRSCSCLTQLSSHGTKAWAAELATAKRFQASTCRHVPQAAGQQAGALATTCYLQSLCLDPQPIKPHARGQVWAVKLCLSYISKRTETAECIFSIVPKGIPVWEKHDSTKQFEGKLQTSENWNSK